MASQEVLTALEALHRELNKIEPAIRHIETAIQVTEAVKSIPEKHLGLLEELKRNETSYKTELKDLFSKELSSLADENKKLQGTTSEIQKQVKIEQESLSKLKDTVQSFHERIEKVNFTERLDKLDTTVAGIMSAIQSVQSRLDALERNIYDRIKDLSEYEKESREVLLSEVGQSYSKLQSLLNTHSNRQRAYTIITWGLVLITFSVILFICLKST